MSGSITGALRTAQSGLRTNQAALDASANNIANVNTEGYSRKKINFEANVVNGAGSGVIISEITRIVDEGLLKNLRQELGNLSKYGVQTNFFERMQEMFGAPADNTSISHIISSFTQSLDSLIDAPSSSLTQNEMVRKAREMVVRFQDMTTTVQDLRLQADQAISSAVTDINALTASIGDFNDKIVRYSSAGRDVSDLRDQRDLAVDKLAALVEIRYFYRSDGDIVVFTSSGRTLVDNIPSTLSHTPTSSISATSTHSQGDIDGIYVGAKIAGNDLTKDITGGALKGYIDLRDDVLTNLQSQLDELAAEIKTVFNQVHNRGTAYPGAQSMSGTRIFVSPANQTIDIDPSNSAADVTISLYDNDGNQSATTTLNTIMQVAYGAGDRAAKASYAPWTVNEVAAHIQDWLLINGTAAATVSAATGKLEINLNSTTLNLAFRDETAPANGSTQADISIGFDANFDGAVDETVSGFSNFFGLNDFFVTGQPNNIHESNVMDTTFSGTASTLSFLDGAVSLGSVVVAAGDGLSEIATKINNANYGVTATIIADGSGNRLRISHNNGASLAITGTNTLLTTLGMHVADVRTAGVIDVRSDIISAPSKVASATVQWDANLGSSGEYFLSVGDNTNAVAMAKLMTSKNTFDVSGGLAGLNTSFEDYASAILATNASKGDSNEFSRGYQETLSDSLQLKSDSIKGVNLDEEMSNLILFEQAYSAAARVIAVIQNMFDALDRVIG